MTIDELITSLDDQLSTFKVSYNGLTLREKVVQLATLLKTTRQLNVRTVRANGLDAAGGGERIRLYLIKHVGIPIDRSELEVVSGIEEYARRIRELRTEDGYAIVSGPAEAEDGQQSLTKSEYLLLHESPDYTAARRWKIANRIRRGKGSATDRLLEYFQANVGQILNTEELAYVAKISEYRRRISELRIEEGFSIATKFTGRPDLKPWEYVLEVSERVAEPHDRKIPKEVLSQVYARDSNTCRTCNWSRDTANAGDPRFLEVHHFQSFAERGPNLRHNLLVLCNKCHDEVHANRLTPPLPE